LAPVAPADRKCRQTADAIPGRVEPQLVRSRRPDLQSEGCTTKRLGLLLATVAALLVARAASPLPATPGFGGAGRGSAATRGMRDTCGLTGVNTGQGGAGQAGLQGRRDGVAVDRNRGHLGAGSSALAAVRDNLAGDAGVVPAANGAGLTVPAAGNAPQRSAAAPGTTPMPARGCGWDIAASPCWPSRVRAASKGGARRPGIGPGGE
jgi:hypothetical protein